LDSADTLRASLFSPPANNGTMGFQSTPVDRNSTPTPMVSVVSVQQPALVKVELPLHLMKHKRRGGKRGQCPILLRSILISSVE
jgi:hypothetical protein